MATRQEYEFQYTPLEGRLPGSTFEQQTEDAINDIGNRVATAEYNSETAIENSETAMQTAQEAKNVADDAETTAENAQASADTANDAIAVINNTLTEIDWTQSFTDENGVLYQKLQGIDLGGVEEETLSETASRAGQTEIANAIRGLSLELLSNNVLPLSNVAKMKETDVPVGSMAVTKGYYAVNDGGSALYTIRAKDVADVDDSGSIIFLDNGNVAEFICNAEGSSAVVFGYKGADFATKLNALLLRPNIQKVIIPAGEYDITETIDIPSFKTLQLQGHWKKDNNTALRTIFNATASITTNECNTKPVIQMHTYSSLLGGFIDLKTVENSCGVFFATYKEGIKKFDILGTIIRGGRTQIPQVGVTPYYNHNQYGIFADCDKPVGYTGARGYHCGGNVDAWIFALDIGIYVKWTYDNSGEWVTGSIYDGYYQHCGRYVVYENGGQGTEIKATIQSGYSYEAGRDGNYNRDNDPSAIYFNSTEMIVSGYLYDFAYYPSGTSTAGYRLQSWFIELDYGAEDCIIVRNVDQRCIIDRGYNNKFCLPYYQENPIHNPINNQFYNIAKQIKQSIFVYGTSDTLIAGVTDLNGKAKEVTAVDSDYNITTVGSDVTYTNSMNVSTTINGVTLTNLALLHGIISPRPHLYIGGVVNGMGDQDAHIAPLLSVSDYSTIKKVVYKLDFIHGINLDQIGFITRATAKFTNIKIYIELFDGTKKLFFEETREARKYMYGQQYYDFSMYDNYAPSYRRVKPVTIKLNNDALKPYNTNGVNIKSIIYELEGVNAYGLGASLVSPILTTEYLYNTRQTRYFDGDILRGGITPTDLTLTDTTVITNNFYNSGFTFQKNADTGYIDVYLQGDGGIGRISVKSDSQVISEFDLVFDHSFDLPWGMRSWNEPKTTITTSGKVAIVPKNLQGIEFSNYNVEGTPIKNAGDYLFSIKGIRQWAYNPADAMEAYEIMADYCYSHSV